jgi:hypothetical protein
MQVYSGSIERIENPCVGGSIPPQATKFILSSQRVTRNRNPFLFGAMKKAVFRLPLLSALGAGFRTCNPPPR